MPCCSYRKIHKTLILRDKGCCRTKLKGSWKYAPGGYCPYIHKWKVFHVIHLNDNIKKCSEKLSSLPVSIFQQRDLQGRFQKAVAILVHQLILLARHKIGLMIFLASIDDRFLNKTVLVIIITVLLNILWCSNITSEAIQLFPPFLANDNSFCATEEFTKAHKSMLVFKVPGILLWYSQQQTNMSFVQFTHFAWSNACRETKVSWCFYNV